MTTNTPVFDPSSRPLPEVLRNNLLFQNAVAAWAAYRELPDPGPNARGESLHLEIGMQFGAMVFAQALASSDGEAFREEPGLERTLLARSIAGIRDWSPEVHEVTRRWRDHAVKTTRELDFCFGCPAVLPASGETRRVYDAIKTEFVLRYGEIVGASSRVDHSLEFFLDLPLTADALDRSWQLRTQGYGWADVLVLEIPNLPWDRPPRIEGTGTIDELLASAGLFTE